MNHLLLFFVMNEQDLNYISVPRSEWTDDTADLAIKIIEMESEKLPRKKNSEKGL